VSANSSSEKENSCLNNRHKITFRAKHKYQHWESEFDVVTKVKINQTSPVHSQVFKIYFDNEI
jgi:hypothetical protein